MKLLILFFVWIGYFGIFANNIQRFGHSSILITNSTKWPGYSLLIWGGYSFENQRINNIYTGIKTDLMRCDINNKA